MKNTGKIYAYVGTYTSGSSHGIHLYDVDEKGELLTLRKVIPIRNSSYLIASRDARTLYSIADTGVIAFRIEDDGNLTELNRADIGGMRGRHLAIDREGKYLLVAGYHDGRVSLLRLNEDGSIGELVDGIFHHGQGAINERSFHPHITCVRVTPDNQYVCAVDSALDQVVFYKLNPILHKLQEVEILRMGREAGPRSLHFSKDGKFAYLLCEITCTVRIYRYTADNKRPRFDLVDEVSILAGEKYIHDAASAMRLSEDGEYLFCSAAGVNTVACFAIDRRNGKLSKVFILPTAGDYPKDLALFPDQKHLAVANNGAGTITTFTLHYKEKYLAMKGKPQPVDQPNCIIFVTK